MKKYKYVAIHPAYYDFDIGIVEVDPYGDWIKFQWFGEGEFHKLTKAPIHGEYNIETQEEDFYFISFGQKFYLKDCIRTDSIWC